MINFKLEDWRDASAFSLAEFEALADTVDRRRPARLCARCRDQVTRVTDFPTEDALREEIDIGDEFEILGLFSGIGLPDAPGQLDRHTLLSSHGVLGRHPPACETIIRLNTRSPIHYHSNGTNSSGRS